MLAQSSRVVQAVVLACLVSSSVEGHAQVRVAVPTGSLSGDRELIAFSFAAGPRTTLPSNVQPIDGSLQVVVHDGQPMLRASSRSSFLINLPEVLPQNFTIDFDIVPKTCCQPEDIAIEGTAVINQGPASANILLHHNALMVVGGTPNNFSGAMPGHLAAALPGALTSVVMQFQGDLLRLQLNGQQAFEVPNVKFVRGRVLRIFLGGQNDAERAVYLARFRVVANPLNAVATAPNATQALATQPAALAPTQTLPVVGAGQTATNTSGGSGSAAAGTVSAFVVTGIKPWGVNFAWDALASATMYEVHYTLDGTRWAWATELNAAQGQKRASIDWAGVVPNRVYQFRVSARDAAFAVLGRSTTVAYTAPAHPQVTNLKVVVALATQSATGQMVHALSWSWDPFPGVTKYVIRPTQFSVDPNTGQMSMAEMYSRSDLTSNTTVHDQYAVGYIIRFCAAPILDPSGDYEALIPNAACLDTPLSPKTVTTTPTTPPRIGTISSLKVNSRSPWGVALEWSDFPKTDSYDVLVSQDGSTWNVGTTVAGGGSVPLRTAEYLGVTFQAPYQFKVRAYDIQRTLLAETATVSHTTPAFPAINLRAKVGAAVTNPDGSITYLVEWTWDPITDVAKYLAVEYAITVDKVTQQTEVVPVQRPGFRSSPVNTAQTGGRTMRFCVAPVLDPNATDDVTMQWARCVDVPLSLQPPPP